MSFEKLRNLLTTKLTKENCKWLAHILTLGVWAYIQYSLGNKSYGIFIIAFFFILVLFRSRAFMFLVVSVLAIVLFNTPTVDTLVKLKQSNSSTFQNITHDLSDVLSPNSGQEVLSAKVQQMLSLLKTNNISGYELSNFLVQDALTHERIIESAWPIKLKRKSLYLLCDIEEIKFYPDCDVIDQRKDVALVHCH
jgi:hypothetical protein